MGDRHLGPALERLRQLVGDPTADGVSDAEALHLFVATRDEAAFTLLVRRHGPLVLSVCRRVLRNTPDAEDAFQATFLLLARKAASIRQASSLASWLYGVAHRVALDAKGREHRHKVHESQAMRVAPSAEPVADGGESGPPVSGREASPVDQPAWELHEIMDDAVSRLPEKYRAPVVLCYFQGKTNEEAAQILGCPKGTVLSRLSRARDRLRQRLTRRGLALSVAVLTATLEAQAVRAAVPASLTTTTVAAAIGFASGTAAVTQAALLAQRMLHQLWLTRLKIGLVAFLVAVAMSTGAGALLYSTGLFERSGTAAASVRRGQPTLAEHGAVKLPDVPLPAGALVRLGRLQPQLRVGMILSIAFAPNGRTVAVAGGDQTVYLWDVARQQEVGRWPGHRMAVRALGFSPDGAMLAAAEPDQTIRLWDTAASKEIRTWQASGGAIEVVAFAPNGKTLAAGGRDGVIRLWDVTGTPLQTLTGHRGAIQCLAFTRDGRCLASGSDDNSARLWDIASGKELHALQGHAGRVQAVAFSPDGAVLASGGKDTRVLLWDVAAGMQHRAFRSTFVDQLTFTADGKALLAFHGGGVSRWDLASGQQKQFPAGVPTLTPRGAFSQDGAALAIHDVGARVTVWDTSTGQRQYRAGEHSGSVAALAFALDGVTLASGSYDQTVRWWDVGAARELHVGNQHTRAVTALAFLPGGKVLVSAGEDRTCRQWDSVTGRELRACPLERQVARGPIALSPDGKLLASTGLDVSRDVKRSATGGIWNTTTGHVVRALSVPAGGIACFAFTADGRVLAGGCMDQTVRSWDVATGKELHVYRDVGGIARALVFSPDGRFLACGCKDQTVRLWDTGSAKFIHTLTGHAGSVEAVAIAPDGQSLATGSADHTVRVWDLDTGRVKETFIGHEDEVRAVAFSPDGTKLASGSYDMTILVWDVRGKRAGQPSSSR